MLATFGAGCFWGTQKFFKKQFPELLNSRVGYCGGTVKNPTYEQVCAKQTGHAEVLQLKYDPQKTKYEDLVEFFFRMHDPTTLNRQGNDRGPQYRSVIFTHSDEQMDIAKQVKAKVQQKYKDPIMTEITPYPGVFYDAEDYHQGFVLFFSFQSSHLFAYLYNFRLFGQQPKWVL